MRLTPLAASLPATVPFVARAPGRQQRARLEAAEEEMAILKAAAARLASL